MIPEEYFKTKPINGVLHLTAVDSIFESLYFKLRQKEKRVYSDEELKLLPYASDRNTHRNEWELRTKSFLRFQEYLSQKKSILNILDLGCGNCWLAGQLAKISEHNFYCLDINLLELEQGARVFNQLNINFLYADIFSTTFPANTFDLVIINSALQYFPNVSNLIKELFYISKSFGEIHILDTPFYKPNEITAAKNRTQGYYMSIGFLEMAARYHHHSLNDFRYFNHQLLYNPYSLKNRITDFVMEKDSPFPWIKVTR